MKLLSGEEERQAVEYFYKAQEIALKAKCNDAKCGCVIVKDNFIIGSGFNSPPGEKENQRRCHISKNSYHSKVTDKTCCIHAEQRAIMDALRNNSDKIANSKLYFIRVDKDGSILKAGRPFCTICSKMALDAGISEFILWHEKGICSYDTGEYNSISFGYKE